MLLLAVDTSGRPGSIALAHGNADGTCTTIEMAVLDGTVFSAQLVPQIAALISKHGLTRNDIDGFVVVSGPGSFTGLRVGLAAIKGLAEVLRKPIAAVSMLVAIAASSHFQQNVLAALNAGKNQIYIGEYDSTGASCSLEDLVSREQFLEVMAAKNVVTADPDIASQARSGGAKVQIVDLPRADVIARLGWIKILANEIISPEALDAVYAGRPDSNMFSKK